MIHCGAGISRAATATIACLVEIENVSLADAFYWVKSVRPFINPNSSFRDQLKQRYGLRDVVKQDSLRMGAKVEDDSSLVGNENGHLGPSEVQQDSEQSFRPDAKLADVRSSGALYHGEIGAPFQGSEDRWSSGPQQANPDNLAQFDHEHMTGIGHVSTHDVARASTTIVHGEMTAAMSMEDEPPPISRQRTGGVAPTYLETPIDPDPRPPTNPRADPGPLISELRNMINDFDFAENSITTAALDAASSLNDFLHPKNQQTKTSSSTAHRFSESSASTDVGDAILAHNQASITRHQST